jgi:hypothetical protein
MKVDAETACLNGLRSVYKITELVFVHLDGSRELFGTLVPGKVAGG